MGADFFHGKYGGIYDIMRTGPAEELNKTINAQPAIYLHDLAVAEELRVRGVAPDCVAGFSLGEIPALVFAGALSKDEGLELVQIRARAMQKCCEEKPGTMVAVVRLDRNKLLGIVDEMEDVWAVNFNSPEQIVCSCSLDEVDAFCNAVVAAGGRALRLKVSGAFHSPYMDRASEAIERHLAGKEVKTTKIPVYANANARPYCGGYKRLIAEQINHSVVWQAAVENMLADGVRTFIEVGPGTALAGFVRKIVEHGSVEGVKILSVSNMAEISAVIKEERT